VNFPDRLKSSAAQVKKPAIQQTGKSALRNRQPLKRLNHFCSCLHRAEAAVLMKYQTHFKIVRRFIFLLIRFAAR